MRKFFAAAVASAVALVGFAGIASASATIDLIWAGTGTDTTDTVADSSSITLQVILTAGPAGSQGAGVSVDYSGALPGVTVTTFAATIGGPLPLLLGTPADTGSRVENVNSASFPPYVGTGLTAAGMSHQLGTVTFHKSADLGNGTFELRSDANGPTDDVLNLAGGVITSTTTFNSAFLINVPEPGAIAMLAMGLGGMLLAGRGRRS
ncbi:MAG: PEP-CTERM sorting domain-containing protein [Deltaproteobacteria bacterium]|nr:PEP-CTERM sorting domain-containing protein [Deltaproteobacteria bacterium]MBW2691379.1 PEP-CTERM sorting domain-containing protein [Deltaproteobacteria bacterium]